MGYDTISDFYAFFLDVTFVCSSSSLILRKQMVLPYIISYIYVVYYKCNILSNPSGIKFNKEAVKSGSAMENHLDVVMLTNLLDSFSCFYYI